MPPSPSYITKLALKLLGLLLLSIVIFGAFYWIRGQFWHDVFSADGTPSLSDCVYFSVVTFTTLGYGDLSPAGCARLIACVEAIYGLAYVGYSISLIVSAKQEALTEYLANDRLTQTYDECLEGVSDAKELIADRRRSIQQKVPVITIEFMFNRSNPFYPALRSMQVLNGYTAHVAAFGRADDLSARVERASHHVEELASFTRKYVNLLAASNVSWRTERTSHIIRQLCTAIDLFSSTYVVHTRYADTPYKAGGLYRDVVADITKRIRSTVGGP